MREENPLSTPSSSDAHSPSTQDGLKHILVVEDDLFIGELIKDALNGEPDYQVSVVSDGLRALEMISANRYDLTILDISLPGINGFEVHDRLQANPASSAIPVLFISASISANEFRKRGVVSFLPKPFELDELFDTVSRLLAGSLLPSSEAKSTTGRAIWRQGVCDSPAACQHFPYVWYNYSAGPTLMGRTAVRSFFIKLITGGAGRGKMATSSRKLDHVRIASQASSENAGFSGFGDVTLVHRALPELRSADLDFSADFLGHHLSYPLLITGMTGGHPQVAQINANLATAAQKLGIAMGVGSQRAAIEDPTLAASFRIARDYAPDILMLANLGIAQLIKGYGLAEARAALAMIDAQALAIHLNAAQEALQPEGDTDFSGGLEHISRLASGLGVPIMIKETGAGIAREEAMLIERAGASAIDASGLGGTSFAIIERVRQTEASTGGALLESNDENAWTDVWGIPTVASVVELRRYTKLEVVASGGVRNGLDAARALALGASVVALGRPLVVAAQESAAAVEQVLQRLISELRLAMFLTGSRTVADLREADAVIMGRSRNWLEARGVEYKEYANRHLSRMIAPALVAEQ